MTTTTVKLTSATLRRITEKVYGRPKLALNELCALTKDIVRYETQPAGTAQDPEWRCTLTLSWGTFVSAPCLRAATAEQQCAYKAVVAYGSRDDDNEDVETVISDADEEKQWGLHTRQCFRELMSKGFRRELMCWGDEIEVTDSHERFDPGDGVFVTDNPDHAGEATFFVDKGTLMSFTAALLLVLTDLAHDELKGVYCTFKDERLLALAKEMQPHIVNLSVQELQ